MNEEKSLILLAFVVVARSTSFVFSKVLLRTLEPFNVLSLRFILAAIILLLIFNKRLLTLTKGSVKAGIILGIFFSSVMSFEMFGLRLIDSGTTSFLENSAIIMVPIFMFLFFRVRASLTEASGIIISMAGIGIITLSHSQGGSILGVIFCLCAAVLYALSIIFTQRLTQKEDPINIGIIQVATMAVCSTILMFLTETPSLPQNTDQFVMLSFLALVCTVFGFTLQPLAQKGVSANLAAMVCALNPLSATIIGSIILKEGMDPVKMLGCLLIITGILLPKAGQLLQGGKGQSVLKAKNTAR